jgi:hypothetical protein
MKVSVAVEFSALEYPELGTAVKPEAIYGLVQGAGGVKSVPFIAGKESLLLMPVDNGGAGATVVIKVLVWVIRVERVVMNAVTSGPPHGRKGPAPPSGLHRDDVGDCIEVEVVVSTEVLSRMFGVVDVGAGGRTGPTGPTGESEPSP